MENSKLDTTPDIDLSHIPNNSNTTRPLSVVVVGGGPVGLIFSILVATYLDDRVTVKLYEQRIHHNGDKYLWQGAEQGNVRREQVVTIQNDVAADLPEDLRACIFTNIDEEVWPASRNIPIREVEDRLLDKVQTGPLAARIQIVSKRFDQAELKSLDHTFDALVIADGARSTLRDMLSIETTQIGSEKALGIAYKRETPTEISQAVNVILTLSQTRYLLNSHMGRQGFLNVRLDEEDWQEVVSGGIRQQNHYTFEQTQSLLWETISDGLQLYGIDKKDVRSINGIEVNLTYASEFAKTMDSFTAPPFDGDYVNHEARPLACLIGDAAMRLHFWPGRGLNTGIKGAVALSRRFFWAHTANDRVGNLRMGDFCRFVGFMHALRVREQDGRSNAMLRVPISTATASAAKSLQVSRARFPVLRNDLFEELKRRRSRLEERPQWLRKHGKTTDEQLQARVNSVRNLTAAVMAESKPWPLGEMNGEEVMTLILCPDPLHSNIENPLPVQSRQPQHQSTTHACTTSSASCMLRAPFNLRVTTVLSSTISINWQSPLGDDAVDAYEVKLIKGHWQQVIRVPGSQLSHLFKGLKAFKKYTIEVVACCGSITSVASSIVQWTSPIKDFVHSADGDANGLFYWLGSASKTSKYHPPELSGKVVMIRPRNLTLGFISANNIIEIELKYHSIVPTSYTNRIRQTHRLEAANFGSAWTVIHCLPPTHPSTLYTVTPSITQSFTRFRIVFCNPLEQVAWELYSHFEIYGKLTKCN